MTPIQLPPPIVSGTTSSRRMIPHELNDRLAANRRQMGPAYFYDDSRQTRDEDLSLAGAGVDYESQIETSVDNMGQDPQQVQSYASSARSQETVEDPVPLDTARAGLASKRHSDVDLLPSQTGRESMDTFNPNLDIESRDGLAYDYTNYLASSTPRTTKETPGKHVWVQDKETPSIRSEQGVILQGDTFESFPIDVRTEVQEPRFTPVETEPEQLETGTEHRSFSEPVRATQRQDDHRRRGRRFNTTHAIHPEAQSQSFSPRPSNGAQQGGNDKNHRPPGMEMESSVLLATRLSVERARAHGPESGQETSEAKANQGFRQHRRNNAALRISTTNLQRNSEEILPHMVPRCSTTDILSPKPISPVRQLRLKNSIPQLMKALPPLPGDPGYTAPPSSPVGGDEDQFADILSPFNFTRSFTRGLNKKPGAVRSVTNLRGNDTQSPQKDIPKLRLRMRLSETASPISSESPPRDSGSNSRGKGGVLNEMSNRFPKKLRLRIRNNNGGGAPETVRRDPTAQRSDIVEEISSQQPQNLFNLKASVNSAIRQVSRKLSYASQTNRSNRRQSISSHRSLSIHTHVRSFLRDQQSDSQISNQTVSSERRRPRRIRKRMPNLRHCLALSSETSTTSNMGSMPIICSGLEKHTDQAHLEANMVSHDKAGKETTEPVEDLPHASLRSHLSQRMQTKLRNWVEGAKLAVRTLAHRARVR